MNSGPGPEKRAVFSVDETGLRNAISSDLGTCTIPYPTSDASVREVDLWSIHKSLWKKFPGQRHAEARERALAGFIADNERCASFKLEPKRLFDEYVLGEIKLFLERVLHDDDGCPATLSRLTDLSKCGPGSSVDVDIPNFFTKLFDSTLATANPDLRRFYSAAICKNPTWSAAEDWRENHHGSRVVLGSKVSTVLKQSDIDRTIATEPPLEMFFQLGIGGFIETDVLGPLGINLSTQPDKNRWMAKIGSVSGKWATIDLKSASNSISMPLLELFPPWFRRWLTRCRSPKTFVPGRGWIDLHMVASMGNGFCFPLQTLLFVSVVHAVYRLAGKQARFGSSRSEGFITDSLTRPPEFNAGVFGDDIIVDSDVYFETVRALELLGFEVNLDKSYHVGPFRESCGHDYFCGVNVRGVYVKRLDRRTDCYSLINRLNRWSTRTGIRTLESVKHLLTRVGFHPIPFIDGDDEGVKVPETWWYPKIYSISTQGTPMYWGTLHRQERFKVQEYDWQGPGKVRDYVMGNNRDGVFVSFLGGYLRDGFLSLRGDRDDGMSSSKPEVRLRCVPSWDYVPTAVGRFDLRDRDWNVYVAEVMDFAIPQLKRFT